MGRKAPGVVSGCGVMFCGRAVLEEFKLLTPPTPCGVGTGFPAFPPFPSFLTWVVCVWDGVPLGSLM